MSVRHELVFPIGQYRALSDKARRNLLASLRALGVEVPPGANSSWLHQVTAPARAKMRFVVRDEEQGAEACSVFFEFGFHALHISHREA